MERYASKVGSNLGQIVLKIACIIGPILALFFEKIPTLSRDGVKWLTYLSFKPI